MIHDIQDAIFGETAYRLKHDLQKKSTHAHTIILHRPINRMYNSHAQLFVRQCRQAGLYSKIRLDRMIPCPSPSRGSDARVREGERERERVEMKGGERKGW